MPMVAEMLLGKAGVGFKMECSPDKMDAHNDCVPKLQAAVDAEDESLLPAGSPVGDLIRRVKEHNASLHGHEATDGT